MKKLFKLHWPLIVPVLVILISVLFISLSILRQNQGHIVYIYDDSYIHMGMAKNLSQYGVWGITKYEFTSCSSSLLWTSLLAFIYLFIGPYEMTSFIICILFAVLLCFPFHFVFKKAGIPGGVTFITLLVLLYLTYIPFHIFSGLEHSLHALVTILFVYYAAGILSGLMNQRKHEYLVILLTFCMPLLRYEGLVSVIAFCVLLLAVKKYLLSLWVLLAGLVPITIFGLISISKGWSFFPNSMLMKWNYHEMRSWGDFGALLSNFSARFFTLFNLMLAISALVIFFIALHYYKKHKKEFSQTALRNFFMLLLYMVNAILYFLFTNSSFAARYHMFLTSLALFILPVIVLGKDPGSIKSPRFNVIKWSSGAAVLILMMYFVKFTGPSFFTELKDYSTNVYEQQYQIGKFFNKYYENEVIALNDIGTTGYFADVKMVDVWGLADMEVFRMRNGIYSESDLTYLVNTRRPKIAIVDEKWYDPRRDPKRNYHSEKDNIIPQEWIKVGEWKLFNPKICGDRVAIFALDPSEKDNLVRNLKEFSESMPPGIQQMGFYTENVK